jgi:hypothetical protein
MNFLTIRFLKKESRNDEIRRDRIIGLSYGYHISKRNDVFDIKYKKRINDDSIAFLNNSMFRVTLQNGSMFTLSGNTFTFSMADGTSCTIGGGDLIVNGISLVHHVHDGVEPGDGTTGEPVGGA